jgi:hypothetical protein
LKVSGREPVPHHPLLLSSVLLAFHFLHTRGFTSPNPTRENDTKTLSFSTLNFQKSGAKFLIWKNDNNRAALKIVIN